MGTGFVEWQLAIFENANHVLTGNAKQIRGVLRTQLMVCRKDGNGLTFLHVVENLHQQLSHRFSDGLQFTPLKCAKLSVVETGIYARAEVSLPQPLSRS